MEIRKQREEKKFREKLENRQKMIDRQIRELSLIKNEEENRLAGQIEEAEIKAQENYERKQRRKEELMNQIERSRQQQMARK